MCVACNPGVMALLNAMPSRRNLLAGGALLAASTVLPSAVRAQSRRAEILFRNCKVITMDPAKPAAQAVAVADGKIMAVGSESELEGLRTPQTKVIDVAGGTLLPGLMDPHMHTTFVLFEGWLDASPFANKSIEEIVGKLKAAAEKAAPGAWVQAWQFDATITPGKTKIDLALLDQIAPNNPLFLHESNGHVAHVNSKALQVAGITRDTPNPPQARFGRDADGNLSGRLEEAAALIPFTSKMPQPKPEQVFASIQQLFQTAASRGCTGLFDAGIGMSGTDHLTLLQNVMAKNPPIRFGGALVSTEMKAWLAAGLKPGFGSDRFRISAIKAWSDGSNQAMTGYQRAPYLNSSSRGSLNYSQAELTAAIREAHDDGWQVLVHSNGDAAIDVTLDAYETVLKAKPGADHRHRVEHCTVLHDDQIIRLKALGLSPSFLIGHVHYWGRAFRDNILGPERADLLDRCASVLKAGLRPSLHSDWNVTDIAPLHMVEQAVTRILHDGGEVLNPAERVPVEAALRMVTADAAWQCRRDFTGTIEAGKAADLVVLDKDPTKVDPTTIGSIGVRETWLDGERRFQA